MKRSFRYGPRGSFPVRFDARIPSRDLWIEVASIPGVRPTKKGFKCTWDAADILAEALGVDAPEPPAPLRRDEIAGLAEYRRLGLHKKLWEHQRKRARFIAERSWSVLSDDTRTGKTYSEVAGAVASGSERTLIVCPAIARNVWPRVIRTLTGESAQVLMLYGRAANKARWFGERAYIYKDPTKINNWTLRDAFNHARWVVVNFDLLLGQSDSDATGYIYKRDELPGWVDRIVSWDPQFGIVDEAHRLRGWKHSNAGPGEHRREKTREVLQFCPQVSGATATPQYSYFRDWWGIVNVLSNGCFDTWSSRENAFVDAPWDFHRRYCEGGKVEVEHAPAGGVWMANGCSRLAKIEWPKRRQFFDVGEPRRALFPHLPNKVREVVRIDVDVGKIKVGVRGGTKDRLRVSQRQTFKYLETPIVEAVRDEMRAGHKSVVFTDLREHAKKIHKRLTPKRGQVPGARIYHVDGGLTTDARDRIAAAFRAWEGPAAFVATIESMPEALSLKGADFVHFAEFADSPMAMKQAEDRPDEERTSPIVVTYYDVPGTYTSHAIELLLPKVRALAEASSSEEAREVMSTIEPPEETRQKIIDRLTAHLAWDVEE